MRLKANPDQVVSTVNTLLGDHAGARTAMAVVSPCSTCNNFQSNSKTSPPCPRRYWMARAEAMDIQPHLIESGTNNNQLSNPVYSNTAQSILLWVATLDNNPGILDPAFDTTNIACEQLPVVPQESQSQLFSFGTYHQGDQVAVTSFKPYQRSNPADATSDLIQIGGAARKINLSGYFTLMTPNTDLLISGI